ncbi:MAG: hypothetical protein DMG98_14410, partial [Acidobacteria bacterium]
MVVGKPARPQLFFIPDFLCELCGFSLRALRLKSFLGATQGIGLAIARALAEEGCNLVVSGRDQKRLHRLEVDLAKKRIQVLAHPCDVRDEKSVSDLFQAVRQKFRRLDMLINNAGIAHPDFPVAKL